jgi:tagaturonate reductase
MSAPHETILQFGAGRFLRAFADLFIHQANEQGQAVGRVVVVQSTGAERAGALERQGGRYHVLVRGLQDGAVVDRALVCASISRALTATGDWQEVLAFARSPALRVILSNTTEVGYELDPADRPGDAPPRSFPAKLLAVLRARFEAGAAAPTIIPCELREHNADLLQSIVLKLAADWDQPEPFRRWLQGLPWLNTLVDRIVTSPPKGWEHPLLASDALLALCEPYALWAIQEKPGADRYLRHPAVVWAADVEPYFLRKVRILNAAHTALAIKALPRGFATVREAVLDPELGTWLERLLREEVIPVLEGRVEEPVAFAGQTLERFRNPFLEHKLSDIVRHHGAKVAVRLVPTRDEYVAKFGKGPPLLDEVLAMPQPE